MLRIIADRWKSAKIFGLDNSKDMLHKARFKKDFSFNVKGISLSAWLYLPENRSTPVPCFIMGYEFGGTRDMGLERYAVCYLETGYAVLIFDYRYFGESDGQPRQLIWFPYQLEEGKYEDNPLKICRHIQKNINGSE